MEQCSLPSDLSSRNSIKEIPVVHEGLACGLDAILLCILRMLNSNRCGFSQLPRALRALSSSPSVSSFSSGECGNAILQYCYGFNRLQLWLLAQGLLQSVPSLQVSLAMLSLAPPLRRAGEGERAEESGDTAIQNLALSTDLGAPIRLLQARGSY